MKSRKVRIRSENMEMFCFGLMGGMIIAVIFIAGGAVYAKGNTERTNGVDSDIRVYVPSRDRDRSSNSVDSGRMDANRAKIALKKMRKSYERSEVECNDAIDYAINCISAIQEIKEYIKREKDHG